MSSILSVDFLFGHQSCGGASRPSVRHLVGSAIRTGCGIAFKRGSHAPCQDVLVLIALSTGAEEPRRSAAARRTPARPHQPRSRPCQASEPSMSVRDSAGRYTPSSRRTHQAPDSLPSHAESYIDTRRRALERTSGGGPGMGSLAAASAWRCRLPAASAPASETTLRTPAPG